MRIEHYELSSPALLAPMAGITDLPFRQLCIQQGAGLAVSEMVSSIPELWQSQASQQRSSHDNQAGIRSIQILGYDPEMMADAARYHVQLGAQIIDINMGCPAKKVNKRYAGSALLQEPRLVQEILCAIKAAVSVPVTLKIRTGWSPETRNGPLIAEIAQQEGIAALTVHGRTRACLFKGSAEYDTIREIRQAISIPLIANGDITTPEQAEQVLEYTGANAIMIGRGAQGNPWIFREINYFLTTGQRLPSPSLSERLDVMLAHLQHMHQFYGEPQGVRLARKHIGWYLHYMGTYRDLRRHFNQLETALEQVRALTMIHPSN